MYKLDVKNDQYSHANITNNRICNFFTLRDDIRKKKSKKQEFGPLSVDPYPPTIKREVLIRDNFDFFLPPTLLIEKGTFLKKNSAPKHIYSNFKRDKIGVKIIFHPFHLNLLSRGHNNGNKM